MSHTDTGTTQSTRGSLEFPSIQRIKGLRRSASTSSRRQSNFSLLSGSTRRNSVIQSPRPVITRVDSPVPAIDTSIPTLDVLVRQHEQRQKDMGLWEEISAGSEASSPTIKPESDMASLRSVSESSSTQCPPSPTVAEAHVAYTEGELGVLVGELLDVLFPRPSADTRLRHEYFNVATVDGEPTIPTKYMCPTAMCAGEFDKFEELQAHWSSHPWNRRGMLVPVTAGGIRRLSFWQHKAKYVKSVLQGLYLADGAESARSGWLGRHWLQRVAVSGGSVSMSDLGDIRLRGPRSYLVSPRVLPIEQVRVWEAQRDSLR